MIIGVILRNFKTYKNINYIPLSNGESFSGFIGANGIGKSSILECTLQIYTPHFYVI